MEPNQKVVTLQMDVLNDTPVNVKSVHDAAIEHGVETVLIDDIFPPSEGYSFDVLEEEDDIKEK